MNGLANFTGEALLEQGKSLVKKTGDVAVQGVKVTAQTAASQLTGMSFSDTGKQPSADQSQHVPTQDAQDFVRELYGAEHNQQTQPSQNQPSTSPHHSPQQQPQAPQADAEHQHMLASTRHQLDMLIKQQHMDSYFNPTFNRKQSQQEESIAEKNEREEQEKKFEEFEKQKKKPDFALQRAQTKTEMSPGASG